MPDDQLLRDLPWLPQPNEVLVQRTREPAPQGLVTAAFMLALDGDRLLLTKLAHRGWDLPGGHLEPGETAEAAARRELWEEAAATAGPATQVGVQRIRLLGPHTHDHPYPHPDSFQVFFSAVLEDLGPFTPGEEAVDRRVFSRDEAEAQLPRPVLPFYLAALGPQT